MTATDKPVEPAQLLDVAGVAAILSCSVRQIWRLTDSGEFPRPLSVGRLKRWPRSSIVAWIESQAAPTTRR